MIKTLSVILPLYNEEKRLNDLFIKISKFKFLNKNKLEFIFVDDGSNDNSYLLIKDFINKNKKRIDLKLVSYKNNKGKGFALKVLILGLKEVQRKWNNVRKIFAEVEFFNNKSSKAFISAGFNEVESKKKDIRVFYKKI